MSNQLQTIQTSEKACSIAPQNYNELLNYAKLIADSSLCPNAFKGKHGDVLIAMQMGSEVGLAPLQALQNIAVINGRPCIWGDAAIALVMINRDFVDINEWIEGDIASGDATAFCKVTRLNKTPQTRQFSMSDAKEAGLWGKVGPWKSYPKRMLQMRARGFALRDMFPDALKGLEVAEEVQDRPVKNVNCSVVNETENKIKKMLGKEESKVINVECETVEEQKEQETFDSVRKKIEESKSIHELIASVQFISDLDESDKEVLRALYKQKKDLMLATQNAATEPEVVKEQVSE